MDINNLTGQIIGAAIEVHSALGPGLLESAESLIFTIYTFQRSQRFGFRVAVYAIDVETADFYATILDNLRAARTPIPTNDIWIAAVSFQHGYQLLTKNQHFQLVPGLVHFQA